ncbi:MAG: hypothetical protein WCS85_01285 [Candidatus Peribacteraceae bacterium]|jgi:hypothetical protein
MSLRSLLRTGIILSALALSLAVSAKPTLAHAACIRELRGPEIEEYLSLVASGDISTRFNENGSATFTNGSECTIVVRLSARKILTGNREAAYSTTDVVYVPAGTTKSLSTPVPQCKFRLELMPYATPQYDSSGERIVHSETYNLLNTCSDDSPYGAEPAYPTFSSSSSKNSRGSEYNAPKKKVTSCINVSVKAYDMNDKLESSKMSGVSIFVDEDYKGQTDVNGKLRITDLADGNHTVSESLDKGWALKSFTPKGATVKTSSKSGCKSVTIKNRRTVPAKLDEDMKITVSDALFEPGQELTYTLLIRNGNLKKKTVTLDVTADPLTTVLYTTDSGKITTSNCVTWKKLILQPNSTTRVSVTVRVRAGSLPRSQLKFYARAGNLYASAVTPLRAYETPYGSAFREAELKIVPAGSEAQKGDAVRFTVSLRNTSPQVLPDVTLTVSYNEDRVFFPSYVGGKRLGNGVLEWTFKALQPNEERRIALSGQAIAASGSSIHVSARATSPLFVQPQTAVADVYVRAFVPRKTAILDRLIQTLLPQTGVEVVGSPFETSTSGVVQAKVLQQSSGSHIWRTIVVSMIGIFIGALAVAKKLA